MKKMSVLTKVTATLIAIIIAVSTFSMVSSAAERGGALLHCKTGTYHYYDIEDAWNRAVAYDGYVMIVLKEDWKADEDGNFGTGRGFKDGAISIANRKDRIAINLNGYDIDRGLAEARENGCVFSIYNSNDVTLLNNTGRESEIKGGNNIGNAGAIKVVASNLEVRNVVITGNKTAEKGGAFFITKTTINNNEIRSSVLIDYCKINGNEAKSGGAAYLYQANELHILDTEITGNKAVVDAGIHTEVSGLSVSTIILGGKMIIADNIAEQDGTGLMLDENFFRKVYVKYNAGRPLRAGSRIVILSKTDDNTLRITDDADDNYIDCYEYENDSYEIVAKGSGDSKYLDIKKN